MSVKLSPRYGVNPTIPICFWCGEDKNEIALLGHIGNQRSHEDFEAPMRAVLNYEPCEKCRNSMATGFTILEATSKPNSVTNVEMQPGVYPTGRYTVIRQDAARRMFGSEVAAGGKAFADRALFGQIIPNG